jgi:D-alanyl-D-alanine carboxypeptidase (penicillin-binding protein 5/6)
MANPVIADIVASESLDVPGIDYRSNTNTLLGQSGVHGIKTGTLEGAGSNLLFSARLALGERQLDVMGVLLGGSSHDAVDNEVRAWLDSVAAGFQQVSVAEAGTQVGTVTSAWGAHARMVLGTGAELGVWSDTPITVSMTSPSVASALRDEQVAQVTWASGPTTTTAPVVLDETIDEPDEWWRLTHPVELLSGR